MIGEKKEFEVVGEGEKLSSRLWGVEWGKWFPIEARPGVVVRVASDEESWVFVQKCYPDIFGLDSSPFQVGPPTPQRERYFRLVADFFLFEEKGRAIGLFIGNPSDWSSYYMRSFAFKPRSQGQGLCDSFMARLFEALQVSGVERVETETAPSNHRAVAVLGRNHFHANGTVLTERWGGLAKFTKFLDEARETVFLEQFCASGGLHRRARGGRS